MQRAICLLALACLAAPSPAAQGFEHDSVLVAGEWYAYSVHLPAGYPGGRRWPAVLVLHGAGSRGRDGRRHLGQSVVEAARTFPERYPAVLVLPQCRPGERWTGRAGRAAERALDRAAARYAVDPDRVYLAGQSMGADGVFELAGRAPGRYAALLAVAVGWGEPDFDAAALHALPVRVYHGTLDRIPIARARARAGRLRAAGNRGAELHEMAGRGHEIFDEVYRDPSVSDWLFAQWRARR